MEGMVNGTAFQSYIEPVVAPERGRGRIVVMDNFSVHKSECGERPIEEGSKILLFLPPYPPDINPMEEVSAKAKSISRKVSAQTTEALLEATGSALDAITPEDIRGDHTSTADTVYPCNRCENRLTAICGEVDPCAIMGG